jgi:3-oxoacyl-[acyl-carrier protein] reductase
MFELNGKVALVTGASRGIGRATAEMLARQGAHVVVTDVVSDDDGRAAIDAIKAAGGKAEYAKLDVTDSAAVDAVFSDVAKRLGRLDILIANAGISLDGLLIRMRDEDFDRTLAINLKGAVLCARAAIRPMMRTKAGRIIFIASVVGEMGNGGQTAYSASKAALLGVAKSLAKEYASRSITVNAIAPGFIETAMTAALSEEQRKAMLTGVPLGRTGTPEEIAAAITFLVSDEAAYITGHSLRINGGMYM